MPLAVFVFDGKSQHRFDMQYWQMWYEEAKSWLRVRYPRGVGQC